MLYKSGYFILFIRQIRAIFLQKKCFFACVENRFVRSKIHPKKKKKKPMKSRTM